MGCAVTPELRVSANGRDITAVVLDRFVSAAVTDEVADAGADAFELVLDDRPPGIALPPKGATLEVEMGFLGDGAALMGSYVVSEVEQNGPPATLTVRAQAANLLAELKAPRTRSWSFVTIGDVVGTIAGRHDLEPRVDPALRDITLTHIDQVDESDLNLLLRLARYQLDVVAKVANGRLVFLRRQMLADQAAAAAVRIARTEALDYNVLQADRSQYVAVVARWREFDAGELQEVRAGAPDGGPVDVLTETFPDAASASNAAETRLRALQRGTRTGRLMLSPGRPELAADVPVRLDGWGAGVDAVWVANRVRQQISGDGYRTGLDIEAVTEPWERTAAELLPETPFAGATPSLGPPPSGGGGGGGGGGSAGTPAPNMAHVVERVAAQHPEALRNALASREFVNLVVGALRDAGGPRWGFHRRDGSLSRGRVAYYLGDGAPVEGSTDIAVRAIVQGGGAAQFPSWADVTAFAPGVWAAE